MVLEMEEPHHMMSVCCCIEQHGTTLFHDSSAINSGQRSINNQVAPVFSFFLSLCVCVCVLMLPVTTSQLTHTHSRKLHSSRRLAGRIHLLDNIFFSFSNELN